MSLTKFLEKKEVIEKVKPLRPKLSRKISAPLRVEPRSNRYMLVGNAFDYLLRFELQRRTPYSIVEEWIADRVPDIIWRKVGNGAGGIDLLREFSGHRNYLPPEELSKRAREIVNAAKDSLTAYLKNKTPDRSQMTKLAAHAFRLAHLDDVYRARRLDPDFEKADPEDVEDVLNMLGIVPFDSLLRKTPLLLNPSFKESSKTVGGADADLITGDLLVDFKVTKKAEMKATDLDQLLGYFFLARHQRCLDPTFPEIKRVAFYFCRHGFIWEMDATAWTNNPAFEEIEKWFFARAKEVKTKARLVRIEIAPELQAKWDSMWPKK